MKLNEREENDIDAVRKPLSAEPSLARADRQT